MVAKIVELVGSSPRNWTEAVNNAVHEADRSIDEITGIEVANFTANIENGTITEYKANVHIAFGVR
jgi:dodecin